MKKLNFLVAMSMGVNICLSQVYQNNTALPAIDANSINSSNACGLYTDYSIQISTINIPLTGNIIDPSKITFNISLSAVWAGDVAVDIIAPNSSVMTLIKRIGATNSIGCGSSTHFVTENILSFNSSNTTPIPSSGNNNIPSGNYSPTGDATIYPFHNLTNMATFLNGKNINGIWRILVYDYGTGDATTLNSWSISVANGATLKTNEAGGVFASTVSIKENPVGDMLLLGINKDSFKTMNLQVYDTSGRMVKSFDLNNGKRDTELDVSNLSPSNYLLVPIIDGEKTQALKFIKK